VDAPVLILLTPSKAGEFYIENVLRRRKEKAVQQRTNPLDVDRSHPSTDSIL